jgi:hypothetical protein
MKRPRKSSKRKAPPTVPSPASWAGNSFDVAAEMIAGRRQGLPPAMSNVAPLPPMPIDQLFPPTVILSEPLKGAVPTVEVIRANKAVILLSVASLVLFIDQKLAQLQDERPNDKDAQAARDEAIAHYEKLKQDVEALREVTLSGNVNAKTVENVANRFVHRIQDWWEKDFEKICDTALFTLCVSVCSLVGAGGPLTVAVSGALVGGKPIIDALKAVPKRLK